MHTCPNAIAYPGLAGSICLQLPSQAPLETGTVATEATVLTFSKYFCPSHRPRDGGVALRRDAKLSGLQVCAPV